jgi:hypothetical protein
VELRLVNSPAADYGSNDCDVLDLVRCNGEDIVRQQDKIREFARCDRSLDLFFVGVEGPGLKSEPAAAGIPASRKVRYAMQRFISSSP